MMPRAALGMSSFNLLYWLWYVIDFVPAVNQSPLQDLHIEPTFGFVGLAMGAGIQVGTVMYPLNLISKMEYNHKDDHIWISTHSIPWVSPATKKAVHGLGEIQLNTSSADTKKVLDSPGSFRGHLALQVENSRSPLLMDLQANEIKDATTLMQVLVNPEAIPQQRKQKEREQKNSSRQKQRTKPRGLVVRKKKR